MIGATASTWMGWRQAELLAVGVLVVIRVLIWLASVEAAAKRPSPAGAAGSKWSAGGAFAFVQGADGRWSTSKTTALLWTYAIAWALLTILLRTGGEGFRSWSDQLRPEYLILLGLPYGSALVARKITTTNIASGSVTTKTPDSPPTRHLATGLSELVSDDDGNLDLGDFQYFLFSLVLLGYFFISFSRHELPILPVLPGSLLMLSGVSAATYVAKKSQEGTADPTVLAITPPSGVPGQRVTITGASLADKAGDVVAVTFGDYQAEAEPVSSTGSQQSLTAVVPTSMPLGHATVLVTNARGKSSSGTGFEVLGPRITSVFPPRAERGATVTVHGSNLTADANDEVGVLLNGVAAPVAADAAGPAGTRAVSFTVPADAKRGPAAVVVATAHGHQSPPFALEII